MDVRNELQNKVFCNSFRRKKELRNVPFRNLLRKLTFFYFFGICSLILLLFTDSWLELGASSQGDRREAPTTFVQRGDGRGGGDDVVPDVGEAGTFPGGPINGSLLLSYCDHVAYNL